MRGKRVIYNISSNIILQIIVIIYGFIVPKIIIEYYGSNINGLVSSITQFLAYISLLEAGFGPVVKSLLYKPLAKKNNDEIANIIYSSNKFFKKIALIFIIYIIVLAFTYPKLVNSNYDFLFTFSLILIISISMFAEYFFGMTYKLFLQSCQKGYIISIINGIAYIINIFITIILAKKGVSIQTLKLVTGLLFVFRPIIQNLYVRKKFKINFSNVNKKYKLKRQWDGLAQHVAGVIYVNTDVTLLSIFSTLINVSIYSVYGIIMNGIRNALLSISHAVESFFGDMNAKEEKNKLIYNFNIYELIYINICTLIYGCTFILIVPFVQLYTRHVADANYTNYVFGFLLTLSSFAWVIRIPYNSLTLSVGHFKETKKGAWIEAFLNLFLSLILVLKFDLIGVVIATVIAASIRTIEFINHSSKKILNINAFNSYKKIIISIIEIAIIFLIHKFIPYHNNNLLYISWIKYAIINAIICIIIIVMFDIVFYKKDIKNFLKNIKLRGDNKNENI